MGGSEATRVEPDKNGLLDTTCDWMHGLLGAVVRIWLDTACLGT